MLDIQDYVVPEDRRVWVVRSDDGIFYSHFVEAECVAIGHIDRLIGAGSRIPDDAEISRYLRAEAEKREAPDRSATAKYNQVRRFLSEISVGDWVVTLDSFRMRIGRVTSSAYVSQETIFASSTDRPEDVEMRFKLRRDVKWGPRLFRDRLPVAASRSIKSNLTVFNIDPHWRAIHHLALPYFIKYDRLYISLWVGKAEDVAAIDITSLINTLSDFEIVSRESKLLEQDIRFEERRDNILSGDVTSTLRIQTQLMSPGPLWGELIFNHYKDLTVYILLYISAFGGKIPHVLEVEGIITKEIRQNIANYVGKTWTESIGPKISERLKLKTPSDDGLKLIDKEEDKESETLVETVKISRKSRTEPRLPETGRPSSDELSRGQRSGEEGDED